MTGTSAVGDAVEGGAVFDQVIIGGGSAGCILAARLSEDPGCKVVLIEAGADTPPGNVPADIEDVFPTSYANTAYFRHGTGEAGSGGFLQPCVMGGGSSVMGMWAQRGQPSDYDSWVAAGAKGWGWADVLPAFKRVETDLDFGGALHGTAGPIPIRRHFREQWPGFASAIAVAAEREELPYRLDINSDFSDGIFPLSVANDGKRRVSSASGYLTEEVRGRANLSIWARARVQRLHILKGEVVAVEIRRPDGTIQTVVGRNFIVSAGAIHSPALLLRSGVGPAEELLCLGIAPKVDLPVGRGLQNHCSVNIGAWLKREARQHRGLRTYGLATIRISSGFEGVPGGDLRIQVVCKTGPYAHSNRIGMLNATLYGPVSRGSVTLLSSDPQHPPKVDFALLSADIDRQRMAQVIGKSLQLLRDPAVRAVSDSAVFLGPNSLVRRLNRPSVTNRFLSYLIASFVDAPEPLRDLIMRFAGKPIDLDGPIDPTALTNLAAPVFHPVGTCSMGRPGDARTVVDPHCRVIGIRNLSVVDASIMPSIPTAGTFLPTMMIAEHAAAKFRNWIAKP